MSRIPPKGSYVEVKAHGQLIQGILEGVGEEEVYIRSLQKHWALPMERVQNIRPLNPSETQQIKRLLGKK